ncbi:unnamed protein product [Effrenium voratum]|uniref:Uncharacterized protein n=1 Tax=Effrenium voratum TaxID=2562239 RepID=A0AA36IE43_9DINO|nr:unnamed protein product [Effrenium voratum]
MERSPSSSDTIGSLRAGAGPTSRLSRARLAVARRRTTRSGCSCSSALGRATPTTPRPPRPSSPTSASSASQTGAAPSDGG